MDFIVGMVRLLAGQAMCVLVYLGPVVAFVIAWVKVEERITGRKRHVYNRRQRRAA